MTPIEQILVTLLAQADAVFEPYRQPLNFDVWSATWQLRWGYPAQGLPWRGSGEKNAERDLSEAVMAGLIFRRRGRSKTVGVRLTGPGLKRAWPLIGVGVDEALVVAQEVAKLGRGGRWVDELRFIDRRAKGAKRIEELKLVAAIHSPALVAGYITSNCDTRGHVAYKLTEMGAAALKEAAWPLVQAADGPPPEPAPGAMALYGVTYRETIGWLDSLTPEAVGEGAEIGALPLPPSAFIKGPGAYTGP